MISGFFESGINLILVLQDTLGEWSLSPALFFSYLGREEFFILILPIVYWSFHSALGLRIGFVLLLSVGLNDLLKLVFSTPRPFWYSDKIRALAHEFSFGIPSGHAQNGVAVWGIIANHLRRTWTWVLLLGLIFMIGMSRIYLAVHFPHDVIAGWLIGILLLWSFLKLEKPFLAWFNNRALVVRLGIAFAISLALIFLGAFTIENITIAEIPQEWIDNAATAFPDEDPLNPATLDGIILVAGAFFGLASGAIILFYYGGYEAGGSWTMRLLRFPLGLVGILLFWYGLGAIFPRGDFMLAYSLRYLRYFLVGIWISAMAPLLFLRLRIAGTDR